MATFWQAHGSDGVSRAKRLGDAIYLYLQQNRLGRGSLEAGRVWRLSVRRLFTWLVLSPHAGVLDRFRAYAPGSRGNPRTLAKMTLSTIEVIPSLLAEVAELSAAIPISTLLEEEDQLSRDSSERLGKLLDHWGSDKTRHGYQTLYGRILQDSLSVKRVLEIGLGTNNEDVVSHMTSRGRPGASLRAFRDFCSEAQIYGADVDRRVLFEENRIKTFYVDQLDQESVDGLQKQLPTDFDLVIDDGLHSPDANIRILLFGLAIVKVGGWVVIEDIKPAAGALWKVVAALLSEEYEAHIIQTNYELMFAVRRLV